MAEDSELMQQIKDKALTRKKASSEEKAPAAKKAPKPKVKSVERAARKLVANNRSELDDLESDAVVEQIRKLKLKRSALAESSADSTESSEDDEPEQVSRKLRRPSVTPATDRIRLKTQPIPIPDRRAALRQSLAQPIDSDEED